MRTRLFVLAIVVATLAVTCGDDSRPPTGPTPPPAPGPGPTQATVTRIVISGPNTIAPGETTQLTLTADYSDGSRQDQTGAARWASGNVVAVTTGAPGQFSGLANGESQISATFGGRFTGREMVVVPTGTFRVTGTIVEASNSSTPISFARVQVRDGSGSGPSTDTDFYGYFKLYGVKADTDFLVSRQGYSDAFRRVTIGQHSHLTIDMPLVGSRLQVAGTYAATFEWASCDASYRDDLRRRTYTAILSQNGAEVHVTFLGQFFVNNNTGRGNIMRGRADSSGITLEAEDTYPSSYYGFPIPAMLVEQLTDTTKLVIVGRVRLTPTGAGFSGSIQGAAQHYGARYPVDSLLSSCSGGSLTLDRR